MPLRAKLARSPAPVPFPADSISIRHPQKIEMEECHMAKINLRVLLRSLKIKRALSELQIS